MAMLMQPDSQVKLGAFMDAIFPTFCSVAHIVLDVCVGVFEVRGVMTRAHSRTARQSAA